MTGTAALCRADNLVDSWGGLRLNSPNDVVVRRDGTIWFTDPATATCKVSDPSRRSGTTCTASIRGLAGWLSVVADSFRKPNGLSFSPDEQTLYVTDSGANAEPGSYHVGRPHHIVAFDVLDGRHLGPGRLFAVTTPGFPDGIKVDRAGRVYASASSGVQVFSQAGDLIGQISLPGAVNFTFGGPGGQVLFITTDRAVWAAVLATTGAGQRRS